MLGKEAEDGLGIGSDRDGHTDLLGSNGHGIWIEGGMALARHRPWSGRRFPK